MGAKVEISYEFIQKAMHHKDIPAALQTVADRVAKRAESIAANEGVDINVSTSSGVRPKGRPFVNVEADNADQEWGSSRSARHRILGRAAEGA